MLPPGSKNWQLISLIKGPLKFEICPVSLKSQNYPNLRIEFKLEFTFLYDFIEYSIRFMKKNEIISWLK
jgi:hypothetical protein